MYCVLNTGSPLSEVPLYMHFTVMHNGLCMQIRVYIDISISSFCKHGYSIEFPSFSAHIPPLFVGVHFSMDCLIL